MECVCASFFWGGGVGDEISLKMLGRMGPSIETVTGRARCWYSYYYVWYGTWPVGDKSVNDSTTVKILEDLAKSLYNSCWWSTTGFYTDANGTHITFRPTFGGSVFVPPGSSCFVVSLLTMSVQAT